MRKRFGFVLVAGSMLALLYGCGEEEKVSKIDENDVVAYVDTAKNIGDVVYSNASFNTLSQAFNREKDSISAELFKKKFDISKLEVQNMYDTEESVTDKELADVVVEKDESTGTVRVLTVYEVGLEIEHTENIINANSDAHETGHSHPKDIYSRIFTDAFTFKDGKLIDYKMYR